MLHVLFILTATLWLAAGQPSQEQCQSLLNVGSCLPWGNCSGLRCPGGSIVVFKCQDPVVVQLRVNNATLNVTRSSLYQGANNGSVAVFLQRDSNNLYFNATVDGVVAVPDVTVPLNASDCACRSLQQLASDAQSSPGLLQLSCSTNQQCTGVRCVPALPSLFGVDLTVLPCRSPPAVQVSLVDATGYAALYSGTFDRSQNVSVSALLTLSVDITQRQYSMDVGVSVSTPPYGTIPIFARRTVILDKSTCSLPPANPTCQALQNLRARLPLCALNQACNGLNCAVLGAPYTVAIEVEPCSQPPSVLLTVRDLAGAVVYNSSVNDSATVALGQNVSLSVVVRQLTGAIGLKVDLLSPSGTVNLLPFYVIPIDQSQCGFGSGSGAPFDPLPPAYPTQCDAFNGIANSTSTCAANPTCDGVSCSLPGGLTTRISVLPCNVPPALSLLIEYSNGTVIFSRTIDRSQQIPLLGGSTLLITVDQLTSAIGFQLDLQTLLGAINIIPYTVIPLNTTNCGPTQVPPTLAPQPGSTCAALNSISSSQPLCLTNAACDQVDCSIQGYSTSMSVLPCNSPPAVRLTVTNPSGTTVYSQTLSQSREVPLLLGGALTLRVTVDQLDGALGIQLDVVTPLGTGTIVPYTVVPLNTSSCPPTQAPPTYSPETTTCTALNGVSATNPTCYTNQACDGLTCSVLQLSVGFRVLPCNSPPAIAVSVNDSNGTLVYSQMLSRSQLVPLVGGAVTLVVTVDQLNNSLGLRVDAVSPFGSANIVPYTVIPLNNSNCGPTQVTPTTTPLPTSTCNALQSIPTVGSGGCSVTPSCDQVNCAVLGYTTGFLVLPCNSPPAVGVIVNDSANNTLFNQVVSRSQQIALFGVTTLDIRVVQLNNTLGFQVDVIPLPGIRIPLIPYTQIPLNTSNCGPTRAPPTPTPPTTTCGALNTITALNSACTPTLACDGVVCSYQNYTVALGVLPCSAPPGVQLSILSPQQTALYSQTLTQSQTLPVLAGFLTLNVTVVQLNGSLGIQVDAKTPLGTSNIIPYTVIPLNTSGCVYVPTQAPTPPLPDTCVALKSIATAGQSCSATALCDGVDCQYLTYRVLMRLLPCSTPPSIRLTAYDPQTGRVYFNDTLSQSRQIALVNNFVVLDVTLVQQPNAIVLQVDLLPVPGTRINVIPNTRIPISTAGCSNSTIQAPTSAPTLPSSSSSSSTPPPSPSPTANSAPQGQPVPASVKVAIGVPVGLILGLLLVALVSVGVFVVYKLSLKRKATYNALNNRQAINMGDYVLADDK